MFDHPWQVTVLVLMFLFSVTGAWVVFAARHDDIKRGIDRTLEQRMRDADEDDQR